MSENTGAIAVIGGSGLYKMENVEVVKEHSFETPYGQPSDSILEGRIGESQVFFLARHGRAHTLLPHEVNYRANIYALKSLGAKYVISVSAVGSLKKELSPETLVFPDQFIDWTKGKRERTFFGDGIVAHVSTADPVDKNLQTILHDSAEHCGINCSKNGSYLCIEGPQFSSKAESEIYRNFGASVIGMTNVPEAYLAKEAGIAYATVAMVTDYDNWKEENCTVEEIMNVMKHNNISAQKLLKVAIPKLHQNPFTVSTENKEGLITSQEKLGSEQRELLEVLFR